MKYILIYTNRAIKDIEKLDPKVKNRIGETLLRYGEDPLRYAVRLKDPRIGTYRFSICAINATSPLNAINAIDAMNATNAMNALFFSRFSRFGFASCLLFIASCLFLIDQTDQIDRRTKRNG